MNLYGSVILFAITILSAFVIILHYKNIAENITQKKKLKKEGLVPTAYFYLVGFTFVLICLPYFKSHALRRYTKKKLSDIFLTHFLVRQVCNISSYLLLNFKLSK